MRIAILAALLIAATPAHALWVKTPDGARIHVIASDTKSDVALVFVPGWMMPAEIWEEQLAHFGPRWQTIAIDPRSQGESSKETDGNYPAQRARDIRAVLEQLGLTRVVLIGASSGVTDIAAYVDQFGTDRIEKLVLVHGVPGADFDPKTAPGLLQWAQRFQTDRRARTEVLVRSLFVKPQPPGRIAKLTAAALKMPTSAAIAAFFGSFTSDYRPALAKIDKPTLIITAKNEWMAHYEAMHRAIAGSEFAYLEGVGHALFMEEPGIFNVSLARFVKPPALRAEPVRSP